MSLLRVSAGQALRASGRTIGKTPERSLKISRMRKNSLARLTRLSSVWDLGRMLESELRSQLRLVYRPHRMRDLSGFLRSVQWRPAKTSTASSETRAGNRFSLLAFG